ncbi:hypothetical protein GGR34_003727 [Microvirga flocculans]|uniref:Uncharacterized protein n=1 Tax=Microvirga flocculans TaxID=217168 RepID=A0A7W6IIE9_9HYPH|nr:hypothetical protein [Microvirga flocculans]MBB4042042.1 hypothetical protein [Microvirga flocculans]
MAKIAFIPELAFGVLSLREKDGSIGEDIPAWLIDEPELLKALLLLAEQGGTKGSAFNRAGFYDVIVDTEARTITQDESPYA